MTQSMIGGMFTQAQARRHLGLIRKHLLFSDGARLMDRPIAYHGGPGDVLSAGGIGRILRPRNRAHVYAFASALWRGDERPRRIRRRCGKRSLVANPIAVTDRLAHASLRQRNAYFSSSDAAFQDRYQASAEWARVKADTIAVDGGWRIYSSGPGLYTNMLIRHAFGLRRQFGKRIVSQACRTSRKDLSLAWPGRPGGGSRRR